MKQFPRFLPALLLASILLSSCADQNIIQTVQVVQPTAPPASPTPRVSSTPRPQAEPSQLTPSQASPSRPSPTPRATPLPILPSIAPILNGPNLGAVDYNVQFELFATGIPQAELTAEFGPRDFDLILAFWQQRYDKVRTQPYEVLKMYLDAGLIAGYNTALAARLNEVILHSAIAHLLTDFTEKDAEAIAKSKPYAIRSYFRGTRKSGNYTVPDWETRTVNVVQKGAQGSYRELSPGDVNALAPQEPDEGDTYKPLLYSSARDNHAELTLIYKRGGWKVDYWTPNVLVLFMP